MPYSLENIKEIASEHDIECLVQLNADHLPLPSDKERLREDFSRGYFRGFFALSNPKDWETYDPKAVVAYVLTYDSYSTWQSRVMYIAELYLNAEQSVDERYSLLKLLVEKLFEVCRAECYQRINFNIKDTDGDQQLIEWLTNEELGCQNLTKSENWLIFEMGLSEMKLFLENPCMAKSTTYRIIKVTDMHTYAEVVRNLIHELAIYERLEEQFKLTVDHLVRDYEYNEHKSFRNGESYRNRFYEAMLLIEEAVNEETNRIESKMSGYCIYYLSYDLKRGRGCYIEDLYIKEDRRGHGFGTELWRHVIQDCLDNFKANFMQWTVLEWNRSAISFYFKHKAIDLNALHRLSLFRFVTERIYSN
jgi:GNAT superfamily N-acetyltransferase